ncbi:MAG: RlmE family RNA methyltransferase [Burkholderiales bacterium]|nr:RlmE family RNA methyltransferase [Burkholderiales bacterium]
MKRSRTSKAWMREHVNDFYVQQAKREGYRSRAAFKLIEINKRDRLIVQGMTVVDLGATPGGWSQIAAGLVGSSGHVYAIDLLPMAPLRNVTFIQGSIDDDDNVMQQLRTATGTRGVDLVISDISPNISGIGLVDQARVMALAERTLEITASYLKPGGNLLVKVFQGQGFEAFLRSMRALFAEVVTRKPEASRGRSNEIYLLGKRRRAVAAAAAPALPLSSK